jgi:hypothetical protein
VTPRSNTWIELGLSRPGPQRESPPAPLAAAPQPVADGPSPLVWLAGELLRLLEVSVPEGAILETERFEVEALKKLGIEKRASDEATRTTFTHEIGATEWAADDEPDEMISQADSAMYQAKRAGKNRVEVSRRQTRNKLFHNGRPVAAAAPEAEEVALPLRKVR